MIVKNEQKLLENALKSIQTLADEIIIVDTGSTDSTVSIAKKYTSQIYSFNWTNNFAQARNFSTSNATSDWIFILDADESINPLDCSEIKTAINEAPIETASFLFTRRNYTENHQGATWKSTENDIYPESKIAQGYYEDQVIRLFRNSMDILFEGKIHETVETTANAAGNIEQLGTPIHHFGKLKDNTTEKQEFYEQLYTLEETQHPTAKIFWEHGRDLLAKGEITRALTHLIKATKQDPTFFAAWLSMANAYLIRGDNLRTRAALSKAHELNPNHYFIYLTQGILLTTEREFEAALEEYYHALTLDPNNATIHFHIGLCFHAKGDSEKAHLAFTNAIAIDPTYKDKIELKK